MRKIKIVYQSQTGFTQAFAQQLAQTLHAELVDMKLIAEKDFEHVDVVLFGGHVSGCHITGFKRFYRQYADLLPNHFLVFGTGVFPMSLTEVERLQVKSFSNCQKQPVFRYLQGRPEVALPWRWRLKLKVKGGSDAETSGLEAVRPVLEAVDHLL
jgi:menaquinone-dependent protoporphyrinogen IX oxidase